MKKLSHLISLKVSKGDWHPIKISKDEPTISHLAFADDVLLFSEALVSQICVIRDTLHAFCGASGLNVNDGKSRAFCSPGVSRTIKESIHSLVNISFFNNKGKYLGLFILQGRVKCEDFSFITQKINSRLSSWKKEAIE